MCGGTVKACYNAQGGNISKHPKTGRYFEPGHYLGPRRFSGPMDEFFHVYQHSMFYTKETCAHACIPYKMYSHVSIRKPPPPPGRLHGRGRLHWSNVLTCCTWARTRRVGVISDGRYFRLLWYVCVVVYMCSWLLYS